MGSTRRLSLLPANILPHLCVPSFSFFFFHLVNSFLFAIGSQRVFVFRRRYHSPIYSAAVCGSNWVDRHVRFPFPSIASSRPLHQHQFRHGRVESQLFSDVHVEWEHAYHPRGLHLTPVLSQCGEYREGLQYSCIVVYPYP